MEGLFAELQLPSHFGCVEGAFYSQRVDDLVRDNRAFASVEAVNRQLLDPLDELHGEETYLLSQPRHEATLNVRCKYKSCAFRLCYTFEADEAGGPCSITLSTGQRGHSIQAHASGEERPPKPETGGEVTECPSRQLDEYPSLRDINLCKELSLRPDIFRVNTYTKGSNANSDSFYSKNAAHFVARHPSFPSLERIKERLITPMNQEFGRETLFLSRGGKNVNVVCNYIGCRFRIDYACVVEGNRVSLQYLAQTKTHGIKAHKNGALKTG